MQNVLTSTATATIQSMAKDHAAYNLWAVNQLVSWLRTKPQDIMEVDVLSSFKGIKHTLTHIMNTQDWWLGVLQSNADDSLYGRQHTGDMESLYNDLVSHSEDFVSYVNGLSEEELNEMINFSIPYVGDFSAPRYQMIQHAVTHGTYHRGQVITIGHHVDIHDAPMTDYMFYVLMAK